MSEILDLCDVYFSCPDAPGGPTLHKLEKVKMYQLEIVPTGGPANPAVWGFERRRFRADDDEHAVQQVYKQWHRFKDSDKIYLYGLDDNKDCVVLINSWRTNMKEELEGIKKTVKYCCGHTDGYIKALLDEVLCTLTAATEGKIK